MSSGEALVLPVAAVAIAPLLVVGGAVLVVSAATKAAIEAAAEAARQHELRRVLAEQSRRQACIDHAGKLRIAGPERVDVNRAGTTLALRSQATTLADETASWEAKLAAEQAALDAVKLDLSSLTGRHDTLARWGADEGVTAAFTDLPAHSSLSALDEARAQVDALASDNDRLLKRLKASASADAARQAQLAWQSIAPTDVGNPDADPNSRVSKWRRAHRDRLTLAVKSLTTFSLTAGESAYAASVDRALRAIEATTDEKTAATLVDAALAQIRQAEQRAGDQARMTQVLDDVTADAERILDAALLTLCDDTREAFTSLLRSGATADVSAWVQRTVRDLDRARSQALADYEGSTEHQAIVVTRAAYDALINEFATELLNRGLVEVSGEVLCPEDGRLFRLAGDATFAKQLVFDDVTGLRLETVRLGDAAHDQLERDHDKEACQRYHELDDVLFDNLKQRLLALYGTVPESALPHRESNAGGALGNLCLPAHALEEVRVEARQERDGGLGAPLWESA